MYDLHYEMLSEMASKRTENGSDSFVVVVVVAFCLLVVVLPTNQQKKTANSARENYR